MEQISEIKTDLSAGNLIHKKREKKSSSEVWDKFHEIHKADTNEKINFFYYCINCDAIVYNSTTDGNTNALLRHVCFNKSDKGTRAPRVLVSKADKEKLKLSSAKYVAKDIRPYAAIEDEGLLDLCGTCMEFGQKYRNASREDLFVAMPGRTTVKDTVGGLASDSRQAISKLMKKAIASGGIAATTDTWTDDFMHETYLSIVVHLSIYENDKIDYQRHVLCTIEISEMVKTGIIWKFQSVTLFGIRFLTLNQY